MSLVEEAWEKELISGMSIENWNMLEGSLIRITQGEDFGGPTRS